MNNKVSICIPTYNGEKYIKKTIESILNQTFDNYEVIIVDDGSTDNTINIIKSYNNPKFKIISKEKSKGMVYNWNRCFDYADGKYILFLFQDDIITPNCLEEKVNVMDNNDEIVFSYSASAIIDENDRVRLIRKYHRKRKIFYGKNQIKKSFYLSKNIYGEPSNILFRKSICDMSDKFCTNLNYTPDIEYSLRISKFGKVAYINKTLTRFRISSSSMTRKLFKNYRNIIKDDEMFINEFIKNNRVNIIEILIHRVMTRIRSFLKILFLLFC